MGTSDFLVIIGLILFIFFQKSEFSGILDRNSKFLTRKTNGMHVQHARMHVCPKFRRHQNNRKPKSRIITLFIESEP